MNESTICLLKECNSGCKMAIRSMDQIIEYVEDDDLKQVIIKYKKKHEEIQGKVADVLNESGKEEKEPGVMVSAFAWMTTEMKLSMKNNSNQIAKIMMDGCNMGIQSITEYRHQYADASKESDKFAEELVAAETEFAEKLKKFL